MTHWLPLVWLVATATATVTLVSGSQGPGLPTPRCPHVRSPLGSPLGYLCPLSCRSRAQVPTPEASSRKVKLLRQHPTLLVPPHPAPEPTGDAGAPIAPVPTLPAHPKDLPALDAPLNTTDHPGPMVPEGAAEEPGTGASGTTAAPAPPTTQGSPGTSAPPCPEDEGPAEACGTPTAEQQAAVAEALGTFSLRFYQHMAEAAQPDANLLFSPINVAMGLSHLLLGEGLPVAPAPLRALPWALPSALDPRLRQPELQLHHSTR